MKTVHARSAFATTCAVAMAGLCFLVGVAHEAGAEQPAGMRRIAFINVGPAAQNTANVAAFRAGLQEHGYVEGRNVVIDFRWGDQKIDQLPTLVNELLALKPDIVVTTGGPTPLRAVKASKTTLPIVFITGDPVAEGFINNLARPGGNLTGMAVLGGTLDAKRLELLAQIVPRAKRIAIVWNPAPAYSEANFKEVAAAGKRLGLTVLSWKARDLAELNAAFSEIAAAKADGLLVLADPVLGFERNRIVEFANGSRLPSIYFWREFAQIGGLAAYGTNLPSVYRSAADYVGKILKGAKPADLPVQQPTRFEFIINQNTAKAMGLTFPQAVLLRADEVIEP